MAISQKYIAGFLDSDGHIGVQLKADARPQLVISFSQSISQDEVIHRIHEEVGGSLNVRTPSVKGQDYTTVTFSQRDAKQLLNRMGQFLVVKRHFSQVAYELCERTDILRSEHEKLKAYLAVHRKLESLPLPKHPTRGWTAGYLDGDGCFSVNRLSPWGSAAMLLHVAAEAGKTEGLEILHKAYGGRIHPMCDGRVRQYVLALPPSKVLELADGILEKMIVKKDQLDLLRRCAKMGHFRDGNNIKLALRHLKAHPHRLNEPKPNIDTLCSTIQDLPERKKTMEAERDANGRILTCRVMRQSAG